jgi:hypothetical protein
MKKEASRQYMNKFQELTSPEDLHIYRISKRAISGNSFSDFFYKCTSPLDLSADKGRLGIG